MFTECSMTFSETLRSCMENEWTQCTVRTTQFSTIRLLSFPSPLLLSLLPSPMLCSLSTLRLRLYRSGALSSCHDLTLCLLALGRDGKSIHLPQMLWDSLVSSRAYAPPATISHGPCRYKTSPIPCNPSYESFRIHLFLLTDFWQSSMFDVSLVRLKVRSVVGPQVSTGFLHMTVLPNYVR
ncbi:hypothetical protein B0H19DRAFT_1375215 [Mycena capillaripes]|nr:hypothetical protein B0H19DRAFT_1375215 [Mycena capillaripes]